MHNIWIFYKILLQVSFATKRNLVSCTKSFLYELPHALQNDLRLLEILEYLENLIALKQSSVKSSLQKQIFGVRA